MAVLRFEEGYFERIWGGSKLRTLFGKRIPGDRVGEAWLIADHVVYESVVLDGPDKGSTLRALLQADAPAILGARPRLTLEGRFPLLLKILDAADVLSVQVHPDDACARRLNEPDVGKTEMWHVLQADPGSELICGLEPSVTREILSRGVLDGSVEHMMLRFGVRTGDSVLVQAGTVHAIGAGLVLAEIQQNSDLTYRLYDWRRVDAQGNPRQLHHDKAFEAIHFGTRHPGPAPHVEFMDGDAKRALLAACTHFAAERLCVDGVYRRKNLGQTFHILLATRGLLNFNDGDSAIRLFPGQALLIPGAADCYQASGKGEFLDYYVPDMEDDIVNALLNRGFDVVGLRTLGLIGP